MIDPKKLMAFIAKENNKSPLPHPEDEDEMEGEEEEGLEAEAEDTGEGEGGLEEEVEAEITEEDIAEIVDLIEEGGGDPQLMELAEELAMDIEELGEDAEQPPAWAANPDVWNKAEAAVEPEGKGAKYSEPYGVVAHVYKKMGGAIS